LELVVLMKDQLRAAADQTESARAIGPTPGPWEVGQHPAMTRGWIVRPVLFGKRAHTLLESEGGHVVIHNAADARLIAAAPELLGALKALQIQALQSPDLCRHEWGQEALEMTRAALSKATGAPS